MDTRQNIDGDRLSSLPNDLIHKILSFVSIKEAIQTSALSSSWRFIWTSLPYLCFSSKDFDTLHKFYRFVTHVLSFRNNQIEVSSIKLSFHGDITDELVKKVVDYAFSHNVQQLTITSFSDARRMGFPFTGFHDTGRRELRPLFHDTGRMEFRPLFHDTGRRELRPLFHDTGRRELRPLFHDTGRMEFRPLFHDTGRMELRPLTGFRDTGRMKFPLSPSLTLKHLTLKSFEATSTWEFPALTTLYLSRVTLDGDNVCLFSKCANLKNLTLSDLTIRSSDASNIVDFCHSGLSNLRLENVGFCIDVMNLIALQLKNLSLVREEDNFKTAVLNVVAPQLKNLTFGDWPPIRLNLLSAPEQGSYSPCVLCSLDKVDLSNYIPFSMYKPNETQAHKIYTNYTPFSIYQRNKTEQAHKIASLLQQLHNAKHLTLSWDIIQLLSSFKELISHQPSPFANLKSLKVYPHKALSDVEETMPAGVKKYLLDGSPGATFTMISSKEMRALENAASAQKLMAELQALLEQEKNNTETNRAYMDLGKAPTESNEQGNAQVDKLQHHDNLGRMSEIISCWEDLNVQIKKGKEMTYDIISKLHEIEGLLTNLPASKKPKIQACYSSLHAEAHTVINSIIACMNIKCNEKQSRLSVCYHELNTGPIEPPPPKSSPVFSQLHQNMGRYPSDPLLSHQWRLGHHYISPTSSWTSRQLGQDVRDH